MDLLQQSGTIFKYGALVVSLSSWRNKEGLGTLKKSYFTGEHEEDGTRRLCNTEPQWRTVPAGLWHWEVFKAKVFEIH